MANAHRFYVPLGVVSLAAPPGAPVTGDTYFDTALGQLRSWDGTQWVGSSSDADLDAKFVNVTGDVMTGELLVPDQVTVPPSAPVVAAAKGYVDQVITVAAAPPDPVANVPVRDGLVWAVVGAQEGGEQPLEPALITLTYDAGTAGFTVSGGYTVDWGDGSAVEDIAGGVAAAHTYAAPASCAITPQTAYDLTSFVLTPTADQPTGIVFDAGGLTHLEVTNTTADRLATVEFLKPVVLDSCSALFKNQSVLTSVVGGIGAADGSFFDMFSTCPVLTTVSGVNTSGGTDFRQMFFKCNALTTVSDLDTSLGTSFMQMFMSCHVLTDFPAMDTSSGTEFGGMFRGCAALTDAPVLDTSSGTSFTSMFQGCLSLATVPVLDTSSGTGFWAAFAYCASLPAVPALDMSSGTQFDTIFDACVTLGQIDAYGFRYNVSVAVTRLDAADLNTLFTNLGTADNTTAQQTVTITGTPGAATCDRTIATAKGWTVTG